MKFLYPFFLLFIGSILTAQINIGPNTIVQLKKEQFKPFQLQALKSTETVFIYRNTDRENLDELRSALKAAWSLTPITFISYNDFINGDYTGAYSFFSLGGIHKKSESSENTHLWLTLWMNIEGKRVNYCRVELYPDFDTYIQARASARKDQKGEMIKYLYEDALLYNWRTGFLKNALQFVNKKLKDGEERWLYKSGATKELKALSKNTLYIPDYVFIKFNKFTGNESQTHDVDELLKKYPYKFKVISTEALSEMIVEADEPVYYLTYIKSSTDKYINVINGLNGEILYSKYQGVSYNLKSKDFKKLAKKIK